MASFANRVKETSDSTGTGTLDLNGAPVGFNSFAKLTSGTTDIPYLIVDDPDNPTEWEVGRGTFTTGTPNTLSRDTVEDSTNSGNKVSFTSGTKTVILTPTAADLNSVLGTGGWGTKSAKVRAITTSDSQVAADDGKLIAADASGNSPATLTYTLLAEATAGDGFVSPVANVGASGTVLVNDDAAATLATLQPGEALTWRCDATGWHEVADFLPTVSQAEAEAGTGTARRAWTAERVAQAVAAASMPRSYLTGLTLSHGGSTSITVGAGAARDGGNAANLILASAIAKTSSAWAVGSTNGGLDTGTIANDTWYHVWLIKRSDTGVVDALFSTSATAPTMPANYDLKRRIGAVLTGGSANFLSFVQRGDMFLWNSPPLDINLSATITTSATLAAISVPTGFNIKATIIAGFEDPSADAYVYISSPVIGDEAATSGRSQLSEEGRSIFNRAQLDVLTDTSARIRIRSNVATIDTFNAYTVGWVDRRGKDD